MAGSLAAAGGAPAVTFLVTWSGLKTFAATVTTLAVVVMARISCVRMVTELVMVWPAGVVRGHAANQFQRFLQPAGHRGIRPGVGMRVGVVLPVVPSPVALTNEISGGRVSTMETPVSTQIVAVEANLVGEVPRRP